MKILKIIVLILCISLFSCKKKAQAQNKNIETEINSSTKNLVVTEQFSEIKYTPKVIGQKDNLIIFNLAVIDNIPIVLYTYTYDYLAYLEINEKIVPFFDGYFMEYDKSSGTNVFKLLDGIKLLKKNNEYIIMFPIFSNEFTVFQLIGFDENASYKDYGEHTYDGETFEKIIGSPYEERIFHLKMYENEPRVYVNVGNKDLIFNEIYYKSPDNYINLSIKQVDSLKKLKQSKNSFTIGSTVYAQVDTYLNVRSTPNSTGAIIEKAYPKDGLKVLEILEAWVKIELNGKQGYVSKDFVR
ncbi:SH3 type 3 domain protein [Cellulophaga algicola DSM 14237]|uniref:SH3 type 3 domain protein n=1 Tax=Cellulophaga algicola (strain DSM 14237 / IC166 / ACAM 630) TaxID=688270 RepID=E6XCK3_CELAD|nr:SH3 domain-containing protein [Cellulophaga algicola]ADV48992.1 SH3 type 3 domain protein [Cellulophaga algicola DSM 14237]